MMNQGRASSSVEPAEEIESIEIDLLLTAVARRYGYDFRHYAPASLRRRIRRAVSNEGVATISALQERLLHSPDSLAGFVSALSVHTTSMFRDPPFYRALRRTVVPHLRTYPFVRIWHAGCASGEEVYSLAIVLAECGIYDRCRIYATDISDELLDRARRGVFPLASMRDYTARYIQSGGEREFSSYYAARHEHALMRDSLKKNVVFSQHNLVSDRSFNEFQMVLCRNVMIYFDQTLRERVHSLIYDSLVKFGILGLGMRETVQYSRVAERYQALEGDVRLYRRVK